MLTAENKQQKLLQALAFSQLRGLNRNTAQMLLAKIGTVDNYFTASEASLKALTGLKSELLSDSYRTKLLNNAASELAFMQSSGIEVALPFANDCHDIEDTLKPYPARLMQCDDAPAALFSIGSIDTDRCRTVGIVGTRHASAYGCDFTERLVAELSEKVDNLAIISGLAYGIDITAHRAALNAGTPTVAVVAHPLNTIYPAEHRHAAAKIVKEGGAIFTEYASDKAIHRANFLARNRIVAGLCDCLVVVESNVSGGAMTTARLASAYNREVMALPGRITDKYSSGCLRLIANNIASVITCADDIINLMQWPSNQPEGTQQQLMLELTTEQQIIIDHLTNHPGETVNEMCVHLGLPYNVLTDRLLSLELNDLIMSVAGGRYQITAHR